MKIIFNKKVIASVLMFISVCANATSFSDYLFIEPAYLLLGLLGCGLLALNRLRRT
ncbi:MAG TPA: hypothetical protein VN030_08630 [Cellvibrio sp.]|nr:hypothetical protein [Cellvibrio sp.]